MQIESEKYRKLTVFRIVALLREKPMNPYEVWKEIQKEKSISYQTVCRYFYLLHRCGLIKLVKSVSEKSKFPKHYYRLVDITEYIPPKEILEDPYFAGKSIEDIYNELLRNPQKIFKTYRERHRYPSEKEVKSRWYLRKKLLE